MYYISINKNLCIKLEINQGSKICLEKSISFKSDENNGHFTRQAMCICDNITMKSSQNEKFVRQNYREKENTFVQ